jgi:hypothetical protein
MLKRIRDQVYAKSGKKPPSISGVKKNAVVISSLLGINFTTKVLSLILNEPSASVYAISEVGFVSQMIRWICLRKSISAWDRINLCVNYLYPKDQHASRIRSLWIAPTQHHNLITGLFEGINLTELNCIGPNQLYNKHYFVWGFNAGCVAKWSRLQQNDIIVFGNTREKFMILGEVEHKFIWLPGSAAKIFSYASPSGKAWLYGFTIRILHRNLDIDSKEQLNMCNGVRFQTQTRIANPGMWWQKLETILNYSLLT